MLTSVPVPSLAEAEYEDSEEEEEDEEDEVPPMSPRRCVALPGHCPKGDIKFKAHGPLTGNCVPSDR